MCDEPWSRHVKHDGHCGMILWAALGTVPACVVEGQWTSALHQLEVVGLHHGQPEFPPPVMIPLRTPEAITQGPSHRWPAVSTGPF